jgi:predicted esterase
MTEQHLEVYRTARYFTLGEGPAEEVWLVCHGYGQRAADFLQQFEAIARPGRLIVAPEALSRFYVDSFDDGHQRVGASWMTRADRLAEIDDYVRWLDTALTDALTRAATPRPARLVALGFSQGGATICRWLEQSAMLPQHRCDRLIVWGSQLPDDLDLSANRWLSERLVMVTGSEDRWVTPARLAAQLERLQEHDIRFANLSFDGGHRLDRETLLQLAA